MKTDQYEGSWLKTSRVANVGHRWVAIQPHPRAALALTVSGVLVVAVGDYLTGPYLVFATFYLIPVVAAAWFQGLKLALVVAVGAVCSGVIGTAFHPEELSAPVYIWNETFRFVTYVFAAVTVAAVRNAIKSIDELASTDPLTGLLNRRRYYEQAATEIARSRRSAEPIGVVYIDVDDLKQTNDRFGHEAGDRMLVEFAEAARATLRSTDLLARLGGDEFSFLLPNTDTASAHDTVERLRDRLATEAIPIRFSAGIVSGTVTGDLDVESAIRAADLLMLEVKETGKARVLSHPSLYDELETEPDPPRSASRHCLPAEPMDRVDQP